MGFLIGYTYYMDRVQDKTKIVAINIVVWLGVLGMVTAIYTIDLDNV